MNLMNCNTETDYEKMRDELAGGLLFLHSRANANTNKVLEVASFSYALIELLMERGIISVEELDERKRIVGQRLVEKFVEKGMGVALTKDEQDKYSFQDEVSIDCQSRMHLCHMACCRLRFALSVQDVEEGQVKWDLRHPYMIRRGTDGYCHHIHSETMRCSIYECRPITCRAYNCKTDKRIWQNFEQKIISPELGDLFKSHNAKMSETSSTQVAE